MISTITMRRRTAGCLTLAALAVALTACAPLPPGAPWPAQAARTSLPDAEYRQARERGHQVLHIDPQRSLIAVTVRRGGALARLGHDHVVAARTLEGYVAPDLHRADFRFRLDQMTVDEPALRKQAGLEVQPSDDAIDGTRTNMLTRELDAEHYPWVLVHAERMGDDGPLTVSITLHGVTRTQTIPVAQQLKDGVLLVGGSITLKQSDFGLVPFSVMGGALAVLDPLELRFHLTAVE